jgi:hypothetical protein
MPHASNADLEQQIRANQGVTLPAYNYSLYGNWTRANPGVNYYGSSGHFAFFCNIYAGQGQMGSGGPGWCASVDLSQSPAKVVRLIHTLDGTGAPSARFGSLHSPQAVASNPNTLFLSLDSLTTGSTSTLNGGPFKATVQSVLAADGTWKSDTSLPWPPDSSYKRTCPPNSAPYTECVTFRLPQGGVCNTSATPAMIAAYPCPWSGTASQFPLLQAGDNGVDTASAGNAGPYVGDSEHFHILSTAVDGSYLRVIAARNGTYDYCSLSPWHGQTNPLSVDSIAQFVHAKAWALTMMPGSINTCGPAVLLQDQVTGSLQELGRSFAGHYQIGRVGSNLNYVTTAAVIYNTPFANLGQIPPKFNAFGSPTFHRIGNDGHLQSYTDNSQFAAGPAGYAWALDFNPYEPCGDFLGCGPSRTATRVAGNVFKIQTVGSAGASRDTYKIQPMIGWAGRFQLKDISGTSSSVDATAYSMCFALNAGECHTGSAANDVFVNVPSAYDSGHCSTGLTWANSPCVLFGNNSPAGALRQFRISRSDPNGSSSRAVSNGWSSVGRQVTYTHATAYPDGQWAMVMGTNSIDGYTMTGFMVSLPPWVEHPDANNDFKSIVVQIPGPGPLYAEVQFGYSRYIGPDSAPASHLYCTSRSENCNTSAASLFNFDSEKKTLKTCATGCKISIPAVGPNVLYYQIRRSPDGKTWQNSDLQAVAVP